MSGEETKPETQAEIDISLDKLMQVDALVWAKHRKIKLSDGVAFELEGRPYLVGMVNCDKRVMSCKKGSQVCLTTSKFLEAVHACIYRYYDKNIIYMMPTVKQVETLSKVSFDPIFRYNSWIKKLVGNDSASLKTINGRSIVFVGAQSQKVGEGSAKDSVNLRSIPADAVYRDEIDLMDEDMVDLSKQRLNASKFRIECNFGSPTIPDYGIDALYDAGDRRKWQIKCSHCGRYTCLGETFPKCITREGNRWFRCCVHCKKEIFVADGSWIAEREAREASFWVDGLMTPMADLEGYMYRYQSSTGTKLAEFERSILGRATIEASCQLSVADVLDCCSGEGFKAYSDCETAMGVDVGERMHVVIGRRTGRDTYKIDNVLSVGDFNELNDVAEKLKVKYCVIDKGPDIHGVRSFQQSRSYPVFRCQYSEQMMAKPDFNRETGVVKCNRNEMCDLVHSVFVNNKIVLPRECEDIRVFAEQMTKIAKDTVLHPETGVPKTRWIKLGSKQDHYFHSVLYFLLAASQMTPNKTGTPIKRLPVKNTFYL